MGEGKRLMSYLYGVIITAAMCSAAYIFMEDAESHEGELLFLGTVGAAVWPILWLMVATSVLRHIVQNLRRKEY